MGGEKRWLLFRLSPHHVGIVVAELGPAMDSWHKNLGISFSIFEVNETNSRFSGSGANFKIRFGFGLMGTSAIELIQPLEGQTIYSRYIQERGPGLHHLGSVVMDLTASERQLESEGCVPLMKGSIDGLARISHQFLRTGFKPAGGPVAALFFLRNVRQSVCG